MGLNQEKNLAELSQAWLTGLQRAFAFPKNSRKDVLHDIANTEELSTILKHRRISLVLLRLKHEKCLLAHYLVFADTILFLFNKI